jgi:Protein of unknown function (DUF3667)/Domain of unknown function (DUF4286)
VVALTENAGVIYEVNLEADAAIEAAFDTWLRDHIADMLQLPGFRAAEILDDQSAPSGRIRRTVQYRLADQASLDAYLAVHAPRMRARGIELFGDRYTAQRRVLAHREDFITGAVSTENCLNCGEVLTGQHCSHCGQRAKVQVISLWGLVKDFLGDVFDWDSRVWRTLRPLAFRPGLLTQEYLRGRRAHYTPPFRMYLILSVVFFLMASIFDPGNDIAFNLGDGGAALTINDDAATRDPAAARREGSAGAPAEAPPEQAPEPVDPLAIPPPGAPVENPDAAAGLEAARSVNSARGKLIESIVRRLPEGERAAVRAELDKELAEVSPEQLARAQEVIADPCNEENFRIDVGALDKYEPRLRQACNKIVSDTRSFGRALWENLPKMMFIFLPLIALVMAVLYLGSGRYYVEHLLFFLHYHAFFFLAGIFVLLIDRLGAATTGAVSGFFGTAEGFVIAALVFYVPVYLFLAMRRVYGQGRIWTATKFSVLVISYLVCLVLTGVGLLFYTALTL